MMEKLYKNILSLVNSLTCLSSAIYDIKQEYNDENGDKIVEIVNESENKFLKVKEELIRIITEVEKDNSELQAIKMEHGYLIKD